MASEAAKRLAEECLRAQNRDLSMAMFSAVAHNMEVAIDWLLSRIREDANDAGDNVFDLFSPGGKYGPDPEPVKPTFREEITPLRGKTVWIDFGDGHEAVVDRRIYDAIREHGSELEGE